ncbi:MAG: guanylate kinase [Gammaproteobacteria bacterium]
MSGQLFIVSAPSGGGKTSLVEALLAEDPILKASISHTTRAPRSGETEGQDYFFVTPAEFDALVQANAFLEHAKVFDHHYGTSWKGVQSILEAGKDAILEIDWQGARLIRAKLDCVSLFILPPTKEILLNRLTQRAQDSVNVIEKRMQLAAEEMKHYPEYDFVIINDDFEKALSDLKAIIQASRLKTAQQRERYKALIDTLLV